MLKINYSVTALQPIFTGSDTSYGTKKELRREKVLFKEPIKITTNFHSLNEKRDAIVLVLSYIWNSIDKKSMNSNRLMGIWSEFQSKLLAATGSRNKETFVNNLCDSWGIKTIFNTNILKVLELFNDEEFFEIIRNETIILVLKIRDLNEKKKLIKNENIEKVETTDSLFVNIEDLEAKIKITNDNIQILKDPISYFIYSSNIPYISGNGVRGILRRLLAKDFVKTVGIKSINKDMYHRLFTGGSLTGDGNTLDIGGREDFIKMCPLIGLLGTATEGQIVQGDLRVGGLRPICKEHGTGDLSFQELLGEVFGTRFDSSKSEDEVEIVDLLEQKTQMKYEYEVFNIGTKFDGTFAVVTEDNLIISCFWRMIELWKELNYVGGLSARDCGLIDIHIEIPENASKLYLDYLKENKDAIRKYFSTEKN